MAAIEAGVGDTQQEGAVICCPACGGDTQVKETRGARRYRICKDITCNTRLHTQEVAVSDLTMVRKLFDAMEGSDE